MRSFVLLINIPTLLWLTLQPYRQWHFLLCVWGRKCLCPRWAVYYFGRQHLVQHQHQHEMAVHLDPMHEHVADIVRAKQLSIFFMVMQAVLFNFDCIFVVFWFWNSQNMFSIRWRICTQNEHVSGGNDFGVCVCTNFVSDMCVCFCAICGFVKMIFFAVSVLINLIFVCLVRDEAGRDRREKEQEKKKNRNKGKNIWYHKKP